MVAETRRIPKQGASLDVKCLGDFDTSVSFNEIYDLGEDNIIGEGAYGTVYKTHHVSNPDRKVAVKVTERGNRRDEQDVLEEVEFMRKLRDVPFVVSLVDFYVDKNHMYSVQVLAGGGDVLDRLAEKDRYTERDALRLASNLIHALDCIHDNRIVHRDLKLENLLLKNQDDDGDILLCDFGCAKALPPDSSLLQTMIGTDAYMAPEMVQGEGYWKEAEFWSAGCVVYFLLAGYLPFGDSGEPDLFPRIMDRDFDYEDECWNDVTGDAKDFISNLLTTDPDKRWTSQQALRSKWLASFTAAATDGTTRTETLDSAPTKSDEHNETKVIETDEENNSSGPKRHNDGVDDDATSESVETDASLMDWLLPALASIGSNAQHRCKKLLNEAPSFIKELSDSDVGKISLSHCTERNFSAFLPDWFLPALTSIAYNAQHRCKELSKEASFFIEGLPDTNNGKRRLPQCTKRNLILAFVNLVVFCGGILVNRDLNGKYANPDQSVQVLKNHSVFEPIPIMELVSSPSSSPGDCPNGFMYVNDRHLSPHATHAGRKIPKILHVTSKSRCVTRDIYYNLKRWTMQLKDHSFYFHDDAAVDRLLRRAQKVWWPLPFPQLKDALLCVTNGATKTDIWRYLVLWEYGGLYADIDAAPKKFDSDTITANDDGFFVVDQTGVPSHWFVASSRHHPILNFTLNDACRELIEKNENVLDNREFHPTGPNALRMGFVGFMEAAGEPHKKGYEGQGTWGHFRNHSVRIVGTKEKPREYVVADQINWHKRQKSFLAMNMTHHLNKSLRSYRDDRNRLVSCKIHIENVHAAISHHSSAHPEDMYHLVYQHRKKKAERQQDNNQKSNNTNVVDNGEGAIDNGERAIDDGKKTIGDGKRATDTTAFGLFGAANNRN